MGKKGSRSIFDLDRTVFNGPSTVWGLKSLARGNLLGHHMHDLERLEAFNNPGGNQVPYISEAGKILGRVIGSVPEDALRRNAMETAELWRAQVFREMEEEIGEAKQRGDILVISHGPDAFVRPFAKLLGADYAIGRTSEDYIERRKPSKVTMAKIACQQAGVDFVLNDPAWETYVYGDEEHDALLMREEGTVPVLVNPMTLALREEGEAKGWRIIDCQDINRYGQYGNLEGTFLAELQ